MNLTLVKRDIVLLLSLLYLFSCGNESEPEPACIENIVSEAYAGEIITLSSCNANASDYSWHISSGGHYGKTLSGQTINFAIPGDIVGILRIKLTVNGVSKDVNVTVKSPSKIFGEADAYQFDDLAITHIPNGNYFIYGTILADTRRPYSLVVDKSFNKINSTHGEPYTHVYSSTVLSITDGINAIGRSAESSHFVNRFYDHNANLIWEKSFGASSATSDPLMLISALDIGNILAASSKNMNKKSSYLYKLLGQGIGWSAKINHSEQSIIQHVIKTNNSYIVLSDDPTINKACIAIVDKNGNVTEQKELSITLELDTPVGKAKIVNAADKYAVAIPQKTIGTKFFLFNSDFSLISETMVSGVSEVYLLDYVENSFVIFGNGGEMIRLDNNGLLLSRNDFLNDDTSKIQNVIKNNEGNYVILSQSYGGDYWNKIQVVVVTPTGKVIK